MRRLQPVFAGSWTAPRRFRRCRGGRGCDDDDACTVKDACTDKACVGDKKDCDDGNGCTDDSCDSKTGCVHLANTATCTDDDACTVQDACTDKACVGDKKVCDDGNGCTDDSCDKKSGCVHLANTATCTDDDPCTVKDVCKNAGCAGDKRDCDDKNVCTSDSCDKKSGCVHEANTVTCDDGDACTVKDVCAGKACGGAKRSCDDKNVCTSDSCDKTTGCVNGANTVSCDDGDACTVKDSCKDKGCSGAKKGCDDGNPCTDESCDKKTGCVSTPNTASCSDGDKCTDDGCKQGKCVSVAKVCVGHACATKSCDASTGVCVAKNRADGVGCGGGHTIAHEFGHYLERTLFRSDTIGGRHAFGEVLNPRTAFGEGYGNGLSGMVWADPIYVAVSGKGQASGFESDFGVARSGNDASFHSEMSVAYALYQLWDRRDPKPNSGSFDRIYQVLAGPQKTGEAATSMLTFVAYYNALFGSEAEGLRQIVEQGLQTPLDAACLGTCAGKGDKADVWDTNNDLGAAYAPRLYYPHSKGALRSASFWQAYPLLKSGTRTGDGHDVALPASYLAPFNKAGGVRQYRWVGTGLKTQIRVKNLGSGSCSSDVLNLIVRDRGVVVASDYKSSGSTAGCPVVSFQSESGVTYVVVVQVPFKDKVASVKSWDIEVTP